MIANVRWKESDYWLDATASGEGAALDTLMHADFGMALALDGMPQGVEPMPARLGNQPGEFITATFDLGKAERGAPGSGRR